MKTFKNFKNIILALALLQALLLCACAAEENPQKKELLPQLYISELMASNKGFIQDEDGLFSDWLELYNAGSEAVELEGFSLSDGKNSWRFPAMSIGSGEYVLIFCSSEGSSALHADFSLSAAGETVSLLSPLGNEVHSISYTDAPEDRSFTEDADGKLAICQLPSPGYENSEEGYVQFQSRLHSDSPLLINEVMSYNDWFLPLNGEYYDLVELKNVSDGEINLSDYYLSDKLKEYNVYPLPDISLAPGELYVVQCSENKDGAPFGISSECDQLFLSRKDGSLCDHASVAGIPYGGSFGRMEGENGFFYFSAANPGQDNVNGGRCMAQKPVADGEDGVFNGVDSVTVSLSAPGTIYYTTDGSLPHSGSQLYTGPITVSANTVIRAINVEEGKLTSPSLDLSYILNENHTLPVVSLVADPEAIFGEDGIHTNPTENLEITCSLALFDGEEGFELDGGLKMHGATSRVAAAKKSFKVNFRPRYEGALNYDLFENGVTEFSSILLRSAQEDSVSTQMRDILMHNLAAMICPDLPRQDYKYCILYINGQYRGIYALREAHDVEHYANHYGYDVEQVEHWKESWPDNSRAEEIYSYILTHDMSVPENYAFAKEHVHIESLIAWNIIQSYSCNLDLNSPNMRFYYSPEDDQLRYALVDLDLGLFPMGTGFEISFNSGYRYSDLCRKLLESPEFCDLFVRRLSEALHGPLSEENVLAEIDRLAAEIRDEIPRDYSHWGKMPHYWEQMIENYLRNCVSDRETALPRSIKKYIKLTPERYDELFGDLFPAK